MTIQYRYICDECKAELDINQLIQQFERRCNGDYVNSWIYYCPYCNEIVEHEDEPLSGYIQEWERES